MKIHRSTGYIHIDLSGAEAKVLLDELSGVRGGSRLPKLRQICARLEASLGLDTPPNRGGRQRKDPGGEDVV